MSDLRVIDTHTHFYDPKRPQGIPWPNKNDEFLYRTVLPDEYKAVTKPLGVHGTVVVEASKRFEDNLWVLELAKTEPFIIGFVGNLQLNSDDFDVRLDKLRVDPLFRGIRLGGIITKQLTKLEQARLEHLAYYDLALDILGGADVLSSVAEIAENIPNLRIIIDHLGAPSINGQAPDRIWTEAMQLLAQQANIYCKVSGLVESVADKTQPIPHEVEFYKPVLNLLWNKFGQDRLIYGSNWPVSARFAKYDTVQKLVLDYFEPKGKDATDKVFRQNSKVAYKWIDRGK